MAETKNRFLDVCVFCSTAVIGVLSVITLAVLLWVFFL